LVSQDANGLICLTRRAAHLRQLFVHHAKLSFIKSVNAAPLKHGEGEKPDRDCGIDPENDGRDYRKTIISLGISGVFLVISVLSALKGFNGLRDHRYAGVYILAAWLLLGCVVLSAGFGIASLS